MSSSVLKVPDSAASRAAAHSTVPNNGIAYPAVIAPPVTQQAHVVQRRIENMLTNSKDKQAIEQYLKRTVNGRGQTLRKQYWK